MGLRVVNVIDAEIARARKKADKAWMASCTPGYEKKLYVAEGKLGALKALKAKLRKARLIL